MLLVEDDPGDVLMTREAFDEYLHNRLDVVTDGAAAMTYLRKEPPYADTPRPDLILLDLNLPRRDGRQVLQEIKDDPDLRHIPVVVLTTSQAEEDVLRSYQLHANAYVTKPVDFEGFIEAIKQIDHFFVSVVQLPSGAVGLSHRAVRRGTSNSPRRTPVRNARHSSWVKVSTGPAGPCVADAHSVGCNTDLDAVAVAARAALVPALGDLVVSCHASPSPLRSAAEPRSVSCPTRTCHEAVMVGNPPSCKRGVTYATTSA